MNFLILTLTIFLLTAANSFGSTLLSPETAGQVHTGINQLYDLNFDEAEGTFTQIAATASNHPIGCVYLALTSIGRTLTKVRSNFNKRNNRKNHRAISRLY